MDYEYEVVEPYASALIESLRAYGYTTATAVADIIDNSISAGAKNVWLTFHWNGPDSYILILDDGWGMDETKLRDAMRPGSRNPLEKRDPRDLGRFGLGLKTASFSQCRRLTVASRTKIDPVSVRRWDLEHVARVNKWELLKSPASQSAQRLESLGNIPSGTLVLLECLDRIVSQAPPSDNVAHDQFLNLIDDIEDHIAMVFHRFLEEPSRLKIFINGTENEYRVKPWDPFLNSHLATITFPVEHIECGQSEIVVQGFVLPHKDKLGDQLHSVASGPAGWNAQQGFYVYRNQRLLVAGNWLGLGSGRPWTKEEHYKLARIRLDIPNSLDMDWQIDVKKSTAKPPVTVRKRLKDLADEVRRQAREVFAHRGSYRPRDENQATTRAWVSVRSQGRIRYKIDRTHPLVNGVLEYNTDLRAAVEAMLRTLEETVPIQKIWLDTAEHPDLHTRPFEQVPEDDIRKIIFSILAVLLRDNLPEEQAFEMIASMDAFLDYRQLVDKVAEERRRYVCEC